MSFLGLMDGCKKESGPRLLVTCMPSFIRASTFFTGMTNLTLVAIHVLSFAYYYFFLGFEFPLGFNGSHPYIRTIYWPI